MFSIKLHPNTKSALKIIFATLLLAGGIVAVFQLMPQPGIARIAFASYDGNDFEIFTVNPDGSDLVQLTDNSVDDWGATWSPDRTQLAFRSGSDTTSAIYIMDADGSNIHRVTQPGLFVGNPYYQATMSWSPDGTQLLYSANLTGNWNIWITNLADGHLTQLTNDTGDNLHPDWSPDGTQITFNRYQNGLQGIYVMDIRSGNVRQLIGSDDSTVMFPRWSPSGDEIVFFINDGNFADLYLMNADGSNMRQLTTNLAIDRVATFSPDGQSIVFRSERDGDSDIYTMNLNTGKITPVSFNPMQDMAPDW